MPPGLFSKATEPCNCSCHEIGEVSMHMMPCCNITYEKFKKDGKVDMELWNKLNDMSWIEVTEFRLKQSEARAKLIMEKQNET